MAPTLQIGETLISVDIAFGLLIWATVVWAIWRKTGGWGA